MLKPNRLKSFFFLYSIFTLLFFFNKIFPQEKSYVKTYSFTYDVRDSIYQLNDRFILRSSLKIYSDTLLLINKKDYLYDPKNNLIKFLPPFISTLDTLKSPVIKIQYSTLPYNFKQEYKHRELIEVKDTNNKAIIKSVEISTDDYLKNILSEGIQTSGSLVRGFTVGTNRELMLSSGFRMQMSGKLSEDIDISAALTDENTPIQPEGNTQTLQEVDKVYIEMKTKNLSGTLGDFNLELRQGEFSKINRKLQGVLGTAKYESGSVQSNLLLSGAISKGKYHTNYFNGIEGMQGPYRLTGKNFERNIIIVAGTERVYVDGELMKRGDDNDYIIDYATAELTFSPRRLINGNSRIVVDFEYTDRQYVRNFFATNSSASILGNKVVASGTFIYEADDQTSPIDLVLTDQEKEILKNAGDLREKTMQESALNVGKGKGQYVKKDTLIDGTLKQIYIFAPNDSLAEYVVSFTYVGENQGDYQKIAAGNFKYVGSGRGNYLPVKFLPLPQRQNLIGLSINSKPLNDINIFTELALSNYDANRFSSFDDGDNNGKAFNYFVQYTPENLNLFKVAFGKLDVKLGQRFIDNKFRSIDRINIVEYNRKWNLPSDEQNQEKTTELNLIYQPVKTISVGSNFGIIKKGLNFSSNRYEGSVSILEKSLPKTNYRFEYIKSEEKVLLEKGKWLRQLFNTEYNYKVLNTSIKYEMEDKSVVDIFGKNRAGSFRFFEYAPRISIGSILNTDLSFEYRFRRNYHLLNNLLKKESDAFTQIYSLNTSPVGNFYNNVELTLRRKNYTQEFRSISGGNNETVLIRWLARYVSYSRAIETDWLYNVSTQKSAKLERVFQKVQKGNGSYIYLGDLDSNGIATEDEFRPTRYDGDYIVITLPSEALYPVIDFKLNYRFKVTFSKMFNPQNILYKILSPLSTETFWRVEEKNSTHDKNEIYLMNFKYFLNDEWTIFGINSIQQDVYLFENNENVNLRFRFNQRKGLSKFSLSSEKSYYRERNVRLRWQLVKEIMNTIEYENKIDRMSADIHNYRVRNITGNFLSSDWVYKPDRRMDIGFKIRIGKQENLFQDKQDVSYINTQNVRVSYSFYEKGVIRGEVNREEVSLEGIGKIIPYELTEGRIIGRTYLWRLGVDYRITQFIQTSVGYDGRKEGKEKIINQFRGEVRAFF